MAKFKKGDRCYDLVADEPCEILGVLSEDGDDVEYAAAYFLSGGRQDLRVFESTLVLNN